MSTLPTCAPPDFDAADTCPALPSELYSRRLRQTAARLAERGLDLLAVYGDREHFANLAYLTGFDPRFEEALLLLDRHGEARLLVGNECMGYLPDASLGIAVELFQAFSLMGQPRDRSRPLRQILSQAGIVKGRRVGCVGWKSYTDDALVAGGETALDLPAYLVDLLRELCGERRLVVNATDLFTACDAGLRLVNEPEQIVAFEYAAGVVSAGVLDLLRHIEPGVREDRLERHLDSRGLPLTCHRMISFGDKARRGLASPSANVARPGDPFTVAFGVTGALTCRAGCVARGPEDLAPELRDFFPRFAANYFDVVRAWYETLRVGLTGGELFAAVEAVRDDALFAFAVNPGHAIHLDEWVHSPVTPGNRTVLRSGMALQSDIIPVSKGPFCYVNAEDGVALADAALRDELTRRYPELAARVAARRRFMAERLGIRLHESVWPLGNLAGWMAPYALALETYEA
jgi:Xaa-Pro aminopeptidase